MVGNTSPLSSSLSLVFVHVLGLLSRIEENHSLNLLLVDPKGVTIDSIIFSVLSEKKKQNLQK